MEKVESNDSILPRNPKWRVIAAAVGSLAIALVVFAFLEFKNFQASNQKALPPIGEIANGAVARQDWLDLRAQQNMAEFGLSMSWLAGLSLLTTIVTLFFLGWTLRETRSMARDSRQMAADTTKMLDQSKLDAAEARQITQSQHRAYLRAIEATLLPAQTLKGWDVKVKFRNDGETPALYIHHRAHLVVRDVDYPRDADLPVGPPGTFKSVRPIPPKDEDEFRFFLSDTEPAAMSAEKTPKRVASVKGEVLYQDIFGAWMRTQFEFYLSRDHAWAYYGNSKAAVPLKWGKRGAGGVYEQVSANDIPDYVRSLKDARED